MEVTELVGAEKGQRIGLLTLCLTASVLTFQSLPLRPSPGAAEQMTGSLEDETDAVVSI